MIFLRFSFSMIAILLLETVLSAALPELVDEEEFFPNMSPDPIRLRFVYYANSDAIDNIIKMDPTESIPALRKRLAAKQSPLALRMFYAAILTGLDDDAGKTFLTSQKQILDRQHLRNLFWLVSHLKYFAKDEVVKKSKWREQFMIEAIKDSRPVKMENGHERTKHVERRKHDSFGPTFSTKIVTKPLEVRNMAVGVGEFSEALAKMQSKAGLPVVLQYLKESPHWYHGRTLFSIGDFGDTSVEPLLLERLITPKGTVNSSVAHSLGKLKSKRALPILLNHLDNVGTYAYLSQVEDPQLLPALKKAAPSLKSTPRHEALMLIIKSEGVKEDRLDKLLAVVQEFPDKYYALDEIRKLKDPRACNFAVKWLTSSKDIHKRHYAIEILEDINTRQAQIALINALDIDFQLLVHQKSKDRHYINQDYHNKIAKSLQKMTGQGFGLDQKKWKSWMATQTIDAKK